MIHQNTSSVVQPMNGPERRQTPRATVERFAYINIEPSNGGSVLNVSEGGLCFRSIAPIHRSETIRFWFREQDHRIEVQCDLVWMDKTQKTCGLRFTNLPQGAREPMRRWKSLPTPIAPDGPSPVSTLLRRATPALGTSRSETESAPDSSEPSSMVSRDAKAKAQAPFTAFSRGLATGLLVSALVAAPFLFRSYKGQLGESLIHWGERFAPRPHSQMQSVAPPLADSPPASQKTVAASRLVPPAATSLPRLRSEKLLPDQAKKANPQPVHISPETPTPVTSTPTAILAPKASAA